MKSRVFHRALPLQPIAIPSKPIPAPEIPSTPAVSSLDSVPIPLPSVTLRCIELLFSTELATMSEPASTGSSPPSSLVVRIVADHVRAVEALAAASTDSLDHAMLCSSYENAISLARTLHSSENLTDRFTALATENEDLALKRDAAVANRNTLTARVTQLEAQLAQTLTLANVTTNSSTTSRKGQTDPEKFTGEDRGKLRSFVALLRLHLIDRPGEFPNEQLKLRYAFSRLEGAALEQLMHLVKDDHVNLGNFEAFVTSLEEAYGDPDRVNTAERALAKLCQGNRDFIAYYAEFQCLIVDLNWNDAAKRAALHRSLCEELKDILSIQDLPEDWSRYVALVKRRDMQYRARKAETHRSSGQTKPATMPTAHNTSPNPTQNAPHPTSSGSGHFGPAPMDLSAARRRLSPEECQKRIDENLCLYCGGVNHMARDCPNKPKTSGRPLHGAVAEMAQPETSDSSTPNPQLGNV
jgi:hypothetical protein